MLYVRRLRESEEIRRDIEKAWKLYLPEVDLETALGNLRSGLGEVEDAVVDVTSIHQTSSTTDDGVGYSPTIMTEHSNAEDYEFDESKDVERSIDGMVVLTADPHKAGYTGPQSGIAALKFLQSLPPFLSVANSSPLPDLEQTELASSSSQTLATTSHYIDEYFSLYHPAYPILHQSTFRARVSGILLSLNSMKVPDPRQGPSQSHRMVLGLCYTILFLQSVPSSATLVQPSAMPLFTWRRGST